MIVDESSTKSLQTASPVVSMGEILTYSLPRWRLRGDGRGLSGTAWLMAALLYLTFSSDTNGGAQERRRHRVIAVGGGFVGLRTS